MKELGVLYVSQKHEAGNYWKTGADRLAWYRVVTNFEFAKNYSVNKMQ